MNASSIDLGADCVLLYKGNDDNDSSMIHLGMCDMRRVSARDLC